MLATELLPNTVQVCAGPVARSTTTLRMGTVALLLGDDVLVGEMLVDGLDRGVDPAGSALPAFIARDEGVSVLGCGPGVGLGLTLSMSIFFAVVCHQHQPQDGYEANRPTYLDMFTVW